LLDKQQYYNKQITILGNYFSINLYERRKYLNLLTEVMGRKDGSCKKMHYILGDKES